MESGLFVVIGAVIGALPTLIIAKMNGNAQNRRQLRQLALEMALEERRQMIDVAKEDSRPSRIPPLSAFLPVAYESIQRFLSGDTKVIDFEKAYAEIHRLASESQAQAQKAFDK
ncbi:hypothetical protein [Nitratidesulfovibrio termitidis]|uniref:hypothetical protein n=1 Tax=Nitratidesulfovibrio termitidis TaxID=42252 RepID=UPI0012EB2B6A|nr:hypothetical protein [Nitratidesulfovibrio termitidis]